MTSELATSNGALALNEPTRAGLAMSFEAMKERVLAIDEFYKGVMQEGTDYGIIPGTPKPSLYQPGAQLLDAIFGLVAKFERLEGTTADYDRGFFAYEIRCSLVSKTTQEVMAEGIGSCNSMEGRYRWHAAKRKCPECDQEAIIKGKAEYGGGWICFRKNNGCGAKFVDGAPSIESQPVGKVENDDPYTLANTILKMAQKRAHVAATLNATGASRIFTQDVEDMDLGGPPAPSQPRQQAPQQRQAQRQPQREPWPPQEGPSELERDYVDADAEERPKPSALEQMRSAYAKLVAKGELYGVTVPALREDVTEDELETLGAQWKTKVQQAEKERREERARSESIGAGDPGRTTDETGLPF